MKCLVLELLDLKIAEQSAINEHLAASITGRLLARDQFVQVTVLVVAFLVIVQEMQIPDRAIDALIEIVVKAALAIVLLVFLAFRTVAEITHASLRLGV
jgi:hypothetical protein